MTRVTQDDLNWFNSKLQLCECMEVKLFYLALSFQGKETDEKGKEDPLQLACGTLWTLNKALRAARLIVCDERQLWERLGLDFFVHFTKELDPWNEQNAVKMVYQFLSLRSPCASCQKNDNEAEEKEEKYLFEALEAHMIEHIKPQQTMSLCSRERLQRAEYPEGDSRRVLKVVPTEKGNDYSEGGLVCSRPINAFGELLRVPRSALFFRDTVLEYCDLGAAVRREPRLANILENVEVLLVMSFLYELRVVGAERSNWRGLLLSCPRKFPTVPLFWELGDLRELSGMDVLDVVLRQREESENFAQTIEHFLPILWECLPPTLGDVTFDEFKSAFSAECISFAKAVFNSRAFNLNIDGNVVLAMVPIADMINHQNFTDVLVRKVESNGGDFVMLAGAPLGDLDIGRELWMSYGPLQNWELLHHYGFVIPRNVHDKLPFPLQDALADEDDVWCRRRRLLIEEYSLYLHGECWLAAHGVPCEALRALLRVHLAQPEEFDAMESKSPFLALSVSTEISVVQTIENVVKCVLEQFPNSLDEDKATLANMVEETATDAGSCEEGEQIDDLHALDNYKLCLHLRIGLKEIAYRTLQCCKEVQSNIEDNLTG